MPKSTILHLRHTARARRAWLRSGYRASAALLSERMLDPAIPPVVLNAFNISAEFLRDAADALQSSAANTPDYPAPVQQVPPADVAAFDDDYCDYTIVDSLPHRYPRST